IRGICSEGMLLSEVELGLGNEHEGILELEPDAPVGTPLAEWLGDVVMEIELTANLGRAYSIVGIAREVAALYDRPLKPIPGTLIQDGPPIEGQIAIKVGDPDACPRFTATLIRDVEIKPSPTWMQLRLRLAGMRPINNIVDVTNYVMLETGQPLHAFDYDVLVRRAAASNQPANPVTGQPRPTLIMRYAHPGERLTTLDDVERTLAATDYLVTDTIGPLGLAGVMGGAEGEVGETTRNVLLEAANWNFIMVRRTQQRHLLFSEAGLRFSRAVHPAQTEVGNRRAAELMRQLGGGTVAQGMADEYLAPPDIPAIGLDVAEVERQLGMVIPVERIAGHLGRLQFGVEKLEAERLRVTPPDHRLDVQGSHDLIEEVARMEGYDVIPSRLMADELPPMREDPTLAVEERIRDVLVGAGLQETISYSLTSPEREAALLPGGDAGDVSDAGYVRVANPTTRERRVLRRTLLVSALENLQRNLRFRERVALFEIGYAYHPVPERLLPSEKRRLVIALAGLVAEPGWLQPEPRQMDYFDLKGVVEALLDSLHLRERVRFVPGDHPSFQPGRVADLELDGTPLGTIGELHPLVRDANDLPAGLRIPLAELALDALIAASPRTWTTSAVPRFPSVVQDLAVVVDESQPAAAVESVIRTAAPALLVDVRLFDVYQGAPLPPGKKSLAFRLTYQAPDHTLVDSEVA
ncbi:MAG TPA: phenylalanine--tRNA ligase subunit beta, partial [Ardenticatenaceae bacterium]|nr:phenylalanine--tRNA ligase subunit beta [Ardenticatenaceae bacterium]